MPASFLSALVLHVVGMNASIGKEEHGFSISSFGLLASTYIISTLNLDS